MNIRIIKKIIMLITILFSITIISNIASAYTVKIDDVKAKQGEEFTVNLQVDEITPLANGHIIYDSSKIEFIEASQEKMNSALLSEGELAWIYVDLTGEGIKNFEFKFKVIEKGESEINFNDLAFVDKNGNEYSANNISGNTSIKVNKKSNTGIVVMVIAIVIIVFAIILKRKKK